MRPGSDQDREDALHAGSSGKADQGFSGAMENKQSGRPLRFQLTVLTVATAVPLLLLSLLIFLQMVAKERESIRQSLLVTARTLAGLVDNEIDTHAAVAATLAHSQLLHFDDLDGFLSQARKALEVVPGAWLVLTNPEGFTILNTRYPLGKDLPRHPAPDVLARGFATNQRQVGDLVLGPTSNQHVTFVEVPVFRDGKPRYALAVVIPSEKFLSEINKRFDRGIVAVIDRQSKFVARRPGHAERVGTLAAPGWREAIARAPEGWSHNLSVAGNWIVTGHTPTAHGWTVGVAQLESELAKPIWRIVYSMAAIAVLLVLLSFAVAWWISRRTSTAMSQLADAARGIGRGQSVPLFHLPFKEAAPILDALRSTSDQLRLRNQELARVHERLESDVAQRTQELVSEMKRREQTEAVLRQTQKMDAIGQLTGGIAHDFNNMLTVVLGNLETLQRRVKALEPDVAAPMVRSLDNAIQGGRNAAQLTHRLLAFARQQPLAPTRVDIRSLVHGMADLLSRTVGETIKIETVAGAGLWPVLADANQLENALLNLVVNARDAMPDGGLITIETSNAFLDENYVRPIGELRPGQYVMLSVSDTGSGIAPDIIDKVFEPFFTTKQVHKGTGLGLAMVHGFINQSGGHIRIYSEPGQGSSIKIYLPRYQDETADIRAADSDQPTPLPVPSAGETILIVEDDKSVREYAVSALQDLGYLALAAHDADAALRLLSENERIDLLFTDVVLGGSMNGRRLADEAIKIRPNLPVLFTTGYTRNAIVHHGRLDAGVNFLAKPYTSQQLAEKVAAAIHSVSRVP